MPATTAPAAKQAILAAVRARGALSSVTITHGGPTENEDVADEMIYLGKVEGLGEWKTLGAGNRHEEYLIDLHVVVINYGDDEQATEERCYALLDEVSAALYADKFLMNGGPTQLLYTPAAIESWEQDNVPMPDQWSARILARIHCQAMFIP